MSSSPLYTTHSHKLTNMPCFVRTFTKLKGTPFIVNSNQPFNLKRRFHTDSGYVPHNPDVKFASSGSLTQCQRHIPAHQEQDLFNFRGFTSVFHKRRTFNSTPQRHFTTLLGEIVTQSGELLERLVGQSQSCRTSHIRAKTKAFGLSDKVDVQRMMASTEEWITAGRHRIHAWSVSGMESCIVTHLDGTDIAFDMGYATQPSIKCGHVFISHGHIDHVAAVVKHASHRSLFSLKPATYYCPPHLEEPLRAMAASLSLLHGGDEDFCDLRIRSVTPGETIQVTKGLSVVAFPTVHRVPSQGYLVYQTRNVLKSEYAGLDGSEVGALVRAGVQVREAVTSPEVAYTGDTTFEVFTSPPLEDLLRVHTLITEATYIDDEKDRKGRGGVQRARDRGHSHIQELIDNEELFERVAHIVLVHFSNKYSARYIQRKTDELLTDALKHKVALGITMKQTLG